MRVRSQILRSPDLERHLLRTCSLCPRGGLYITAVWIRQPKELNMKRLLGLLLVMGMVGCGDPEEERAAALEELFRF